MEDGKLEMLLQVMVAFGHGTGNVRVSRETIRAASKHYEALHTPEMQAEWHATAVQALERVEATGRLAAQRAILAGRTTVTPADFSEAARSVEGTSASPYCPPVG